MEREQQIRSMYASFNARDIEAVLAALTADVEWPKAFEGGTVRGHDAVRDYWRRQWAEIDPHVEPTKIVAEPDGRLAVHVRQVVRNLDGEVIGEGDVVHVYEFEGELISRMVVEEA